MMQTLVLNLVVIGLLVALFSSIDQLRSSPRIRLWMLGWLWVLVHFGVMLWQPSLKPLAELSDALATSALALCGISFLLSAAVLAERRMRVLVALALALPTLAFVWLAAFEVQAPIVYLLLELVGHGLALVLLWYFYRDRLWLPILGTAIVTLCSHSILYQILQGRSQVGVELILMELFAMHGLIFWEDHPHRSAGTLTTVSGLVCWAAVFPVSMLVYARWPGARIDPEVWNIPKIFVAFGMIVTLLEEEVRLAGRQRAQYQMLFEESPLPMWIFERGSQQLLEVNAAAVDQYGYPREELLGLTMGKLLSGVDGASQAAMDWSAPRARRTDGPWRLERKDGDPSLVEISVQEVSFNGSEARLVLAQDVTERVRLQDQLIHQANHDPLTGLPNRLLLGDRIKTALASAARHGSKTAILCLDVDRFKQINDTFGHAAGDGCLKEIASRLKQRLRTVDTAARIGGEEFMVILDEVKSAADAERVAEDLLFALSAPNVVDGRRIQLSASIGIAIYPDDAREPSDLWRMSDVAMYQAKQAGGNRYRMFSRLAEPGA